MSRLRDLAFVLTLRSVAFVPTLGSHVEAVGHGESHQMTDLNSQEQSLSEVQTDASAARRSGRVLAVKIQVQKETV